MISFCSVTDVKNNFPFLLTGVSKGRSSIVMKNNKPVAVLIPYSDNIEDILEDIAWENNEVLQESILKAGNEKKGALKAKDFRKKFGL